MVKDLPAMEETQQTWVLSLGREDSLEKGIAIHSSILAWEITYGQRSWQTMVHGSQKSQARLSTCIAAVVNLW